MKLFVQGKKTFKTCNKRASTILFSSPSAKSTHEFEFIVHSDGTLYCIDAKKSKGNLNSLKEFREYNPAAHAIKISANNFGYNEEHDIFTVPHYAVFLLAGEVGKNQ
ncbi:MAG: hypothetical protein IJ158_03065 [Treponema sp.]|nr:hypothetical protein [Treponema sp.]